MTTAMNRAVGFGLLLLTFLGSVTATPAADADGIDFFETKVRPLLVKHCYSCHSSQAQKIRGNLLLDSSTAARKGGDSGPSVVPGDLERSLLIKAVRYTDDGLRMPPKGKLSAAEIADLEAWIKRGAPDPRTQPAVVTSAVDPVRGREFWSFRPVVDPPVPAVHDTTWPFNAIDRFLLARMEARELRPAPVADRRTLLRRVTYDLTGLPPTPEEIDAFLRESDAKPQAAYEALVERLLASPAYGERWARHWLDVVRYADSAGDNSDYPIPQMYKYRNWVIDAFNQDMPYDQFVREQLAGDLMPSRTDAERFRKIIATGYLANSRRFGSYEDTRYPWYLTIEDTIDNLGRTFLGLTINCCRCHDHKFDPLSAEDYYALYGFFSSTRYPWPGIELDKAQRDLIPLLPPKEMASRQQELQQKLAHFDARIKDLEKERRAAADSLKEAEKISEEKERKDHISAANARIEELTRKLKAAQKEREEFVKKPLPFDTAYAVTEGKTEGKKKVGNACVQIKGDPDRLGPEVPRRFPTVLGGQTLAAEVKGSGRLELARWITEPHNPLTARVMVNRIWQSHFGKGIVPTPSNFGKQGQPPTQPELLDYLARRFIDSGWSLKAMHRLIVLSRAYQLSSQPDATSARIDANNDCLSWYSRRRLDAESIRDTMLAVSGALDRSLGGPHPFPEPTTWDFTQHKPFKAVYETNRRSVYLMTQRMQRHPFLALFDGPDTNASTDRRVTSTTPLQALYLMNDPFVHAQARQMAQRLLAENMDEGRRIERAYLLLFSRPPTPEEQSAAIDYLRKAGEKLQTTGAVADQQVRIWESLVRALFLSNEFVYVN